MAENQDSQIGKVTDARRIDPATLSPESQAYIAECTERAKQGLKPRGHYLDFEDGKVVGEGYNP